MSEESVSSRSEEYTEGLIIEENERQKGWMEDS